MGKIELMDCTLRDGGYINDWRFGQDAIRNICKKLVRAGIEYIEVGFIKGDSFSVDRTMFPDIESISALIAPKNINTTYVGMLDLSAPVPLEKLCSFNGSSVDGLRVIFKKNSIQEGFEYCRAIQKLGYKLFVQPVSTHMYSESEFTALIKKFNEIEPFAFYIVDSFGLIKRKQFEKLVYIADSTLKDNITLGYHSHNNLQQAFGNAEALAEMGLARDVMLDACIFGMGRGAGNLNMELFAEYMNENHRKNYLLEPMLEVIDEYLNDIYKNHFWGYSLPFYLAASNKCHPNYALYFSEKNTLTEKSFNELLRNIPASYKAVYDKKDAEKFYINYMENFIDDRETLIRLSSELYGKKVLLIAPGNSLIEYKETIQAFIKNENPIVISVNFVSDEFGCDYVFSSNMRRYARIQSRFDVRRIITSNIKEAIGYDYMINFSSYSCIEPDIVDNSGIMALKLLQAIGIRELTIAGMDGYSGNTGADYYDRMLDYDFSKEAQERNMLIEKELNDIKKQIKLVSLTPSIYRF